MEETSQERAGEQAAAAREALAALLERMGMSAEVGVREDDEQIVMEIEGEDAERLIGKKGQTLDALQMIVGKMVSRRIEEARMPMVVDADGYRERRAEALRELALRLKAEAIETEQTIALNPMSARDRRIIHMVLRDVEGVSTRSEGEGQDRRLLIVPD